MISYLQAETISKRIGDIILFENISLNIDKDDKVALIAPNGAGKSTLLNILVGKDSQDSGLITYKSGIRIGYLEQLPLLNAKNSIIEEVLNSPTEIANTIKNYLKNLSSGDELQTKTSLSEMDRLQAWDYESRIEQTLSKLGLEDIEAKIETLSGGQLKRVALAKVLIGEPDMLILDEPTNHLDLDMIEWLEDYLIRSKATLLMVTHDRYFLDRICNHILELDDNKIYKFQGNYSIYLEKREERIYNQNAEAEKARNLMRTELEWMLRMPKARTHKSKFRTEQFYELKDRAGFQKSDETVRFNVQATRMGKKILEIKNISKSYGENPVIKSFSYDFAPGEKIGIVGKNGTGKTTFLNLITGNLQTDTGFAESGTTIKFGYYRQELPQFSENEKVIDVAREIAEVVSLSNGTTVGVSHFLNYFLFPPKRQQTHFYKLSGGERRRLYLATVLMQNPNFLILDEPTNDLDIITLNVLEDYLKNFSGCLLVVSHDRYFMDKIVDHVFVFKGDGCVKDFPGNYTQFRNKEQEDEENSKKKLISEKPTKEKKTKSSPTNKLGFNEKFEYQNLEAEIAVLHKEKEKLEIFLSSGSSNSAELVEKSARLGELIELIDEKELRWLELDERNE
ncbi:MAG: ABC-F family ATP-binding cassette domain-containing protein [Bacteroidales bacterium]|nr:ABC-F family ATP-binding cassette domain-containing protein [Bacteroidales bacterium]